MLSPGDLLEVVELMDVFSKLSSSDPLLGWTDDELGQLASYGASLLPKSMILNTSVAENSSNVMDGLEVDDPIETPLSLSRTRA